MYWNNQVYKSGRMRRYCSAGWVDITSVRCVLLIQNWSHPEHCPQQTVFFKMMLSWKFYTWQHDHLNKRRYPLSTSSCQLTTRDESCKSIWLLHQMSGCCSPLQWLIIIKQWVLAMLLIVDTGLTSQPVKYYCWQHSHEFHCSTLSVWQWCQWWWCTVSETVLWWW